MENKDHLERENPCIEDDENQKKEWNSPRFFELESKKTLGGFTSDTAEGGNYHS